MKYELIETKTVDWDKVYEIKCIPSKFERFFGKKEKTETLIYKGGTYTMSGHKVFYNLQGDKVLNSLSSWLNSKLHYEHYTKNEKNCCAGKEDKKEEILKKEITFTTTFIPLNIKNLNGHIYLDNDNLRQSIEDMNNRIKSLGVIYGEYNYPNSFDTSLSRVSHRIKSVRIEGDKVVGEVTILNTREGKKLQDDYKNRVFRPRIAGTVEENGLVVIKKLFTFDAVDCDIDAFIDMNEYIKNNELKTANFLENKNEEKREEWMKK